tara:strand:+ start:4050 stop:4463 length:414 start_codon:yes stop_codon:yes gene_type:complete
MAIVQGIRKDPRDLNNIKIGVAFPLDETNLFASTDTLTEQAKSDLINVLLTFPGERINLPDFGVGLKHLLFDQKLDLGSLKARIRTQADFYVPNIQVVGVNSSMSEDNQTLFVSISFVSLLSGTLDSIQLNLQTGNY